jgi:hypothetical protein
MILATGFDSTQRTIPAIALRTSGMRCQDLHGHASDEKSHDRARTKCIYAEKNDNQAGKPENDCNY